MQDGVGVETTIDTSQSEHTASVRCETKKDADSFLILTRCCPSASFKSINFYDLGMVTLGMECIGADGWSVLGKALSQLHKGVALFDCFKSHIVVRGSILPFNEFSVLENHHGVLI